MITSIYTISYWNMMLKNAMYHYIAVGEGRWRQVLQQNSSVSKRFQSCKQTGGRDCPITWNNVKTSGHYFEKWCSGFDPTSFENRFVSLSSLYCGHHNLNWKVREIQTLLTIYWLKWFTDHQFTFPLAQKCFRQCILSSRKPDHFMLG